MRPASASTLAQVNAAEAYWARSATRRWRSGTPLFRANRSRRAASVGALITSPAPTPVPRRTLRQWIGPRPSGTCTGGGHNWRVAIAELAPHRNQMTVDASATDRVTSGDAGPRATALGLT
jgi:hypothetical protein